MSSTQQSTNQSTTTDPIADYDRRLPALIESADKRIQAWIEREGAHVVRSETPYPPLGYYPLPTYIKISPEPKDGEVYEDDQKNLILTAKGLERFAEMLGFSVNHKESGQVKTDDPDNKIQWKTVVVTTNALGEKHERVGTYELDKTEIAKDIIIKLKARVEWAQRNIGGAKDRDIAYDLKRAIQENTITAWMQDKLEKEVGKIWKYRVGRAETGSFTRAIRSTGIPTAFTKEYLAHPFVDKRMMPFPGFFGDQRYQAEQAYNRMYGPPPEPHAPNPVESASPSETVIDAQATRVEPREPWPTEYDGGSQMPSSSSTKPTQRENILADFAASDHQQKVRMMLRESEAKQYPLPKNFSDWNEERMGKVFAMMLDLSDSNAEPEQTGLFGKGGQS